jgi:hypothetical protein
MQAASHVKQRFSIGRWQERGQWHFWSQVAGVVST